jgi:predicted HTH transcriptional regulator
MASPGGPPGSLTVSGLKSGKAYPIARNPLIAQSLFHLRLMEHRGSGFKRMQSFIGESGLQGLEIAVEDGYLTLTLRGPGEDIDAVPIPRDMIAKLLPRSKLDRLNDRQKQMAEMLFRGEQLTSRRCEHAFAVTRDTTTRDFKALVDVGIASKVGRGRSVRYIFVGSELP